MSEEKKKTGKPESSESDEQQQRPRTVRPINLLKSKDSVEFDASVSDSLEPRETRSRQRRNPRNQNRRKK